MQDSKKDNRKIWIQIGVAVVVIAAVFLIGRLIENASTGGDEDDDGLQVSVSENAYVAFPGADGLAKNIGNNTMRALVHDVQDVVLKNDEIAAAEQSNAPSTDLPSFAYEATVDTSSLIKGVSFPYTTLSTFFKISDGRYYLVNVATDKDQYCGVIVRRTLPSYGQPYLYITIKDTSGQDYNSVVEGLTDWAEAIYPEGVVVTTAE